MANQKDRKCDRGGGRREPEARLGSRLVNRTPVFEGSAIPPENPSSKTLGLDQMPPEVLAAVSKMASERKAKWFDEPIPMLDNKTPRQAAKTAGGRAKLENLIELYAHNSSSLGSIDLHRLMNPSEDEIRRELGL